MTDIEEQILDVADVPLGRAASNVAKILMGKNDLGFAKNKVARVKVIIKNVALVKVPRAKRIKEHYYSHSGYLGNLKSETLGNLLEESPEKLFINIVSGMLPNNKIRKLRLKNINFQK